MKTKTWIALIALLLILCLGLSLWLLRSDSDAQIAEVWSDGELVCRLDMRIDRQMTVTGENGTNVITVKDGRIAVTQADCPDHYCMDRGFCAGGVQIVCLPNRLVIRFVTAQDVDSVTG